MTLHNAVNIPFFVAWAGALVFVARYAFTRWYRSAMGVNAMLDTVVILTILSLGASYILWGAWGNPDLLGIGVYSAISVVLWWRVILLFQGQRGVKRRRADMTQSGPEEAQDDAC